MIAAGQSEPAPERTPPPGIPVGIGTVSWPVFVDTFLAADPILHSCIRQAIRDLPSYRLAANAWAAGCPATVVRALLLRAFIELLC